MSAPILVGTTNWVDHENFYPPELEKGRRQREKLSYYARFFPFVEVDTTFYGIPKPQVVDGWVERTPESFRFNVKAYRSLTRHEREAGKPRPPTAEEERDFKAALEPLRAAGRLTAVIYQFPPWFKDSPSARDVCAEARERHPDDVVAIEFRHRSWFEGETWPRTEELLRELDAVFVGVDAPQLGSATAPPHLAVTSPRLCIVRFHGRNRRTWYVKAERTADRFDYLYRPEELRDWVPAIRAVSDAGVPVQLALNNNRSNYAVVNAFDMAALLGLPMPPPPEPIRRTMEEREQGGHRRAARQPTGGPAVDPDPPAAGPGQLELDV